MSTKEEQRKNLENLEKQQREQQEAHKGRSAKDDEALLESMVKDYGVWVVGTVVLLLVFVLGVQIGRVISASKEQKIQEAFSLAANPSEKIAFAETYPRHNLSGIAFLQVANANYEAGEFLQAAGHYEKAAAKLATPKLEDPDSSLKLNPFGDRARLGQAMALLRAGESEQALGLLGQITDDKSVGNNTRAEAAYHIATTMWSRGDFDAMAKALEKVDAAEESLAIAIGAEDQAGIAQSIWGRQAEYLRTTVPELAVKEEEPEAAETAAEEKTGDADADATDSTAPAGQDSPTGETE